jgi:hypothetical protein
LLPWPPRAANGSLSPVVSVETVVVIFIQFWVVHLLSGHGKLPQCRRLSSRRLLLNLLKIWCLLFSCFLLSPAFSGLSLRFRDNWVYSDHKIFDWTF